MPPPVDLSSGWTVRFGPNGGTIRMEQLKSWTEDEDTRYFSGVAAYEKEIAVPDSLLRDGLVLRLDFGEGRPIQAAPARGTGMQAWLDSPVRDAAVVYVNGQRAGAVWCPPWYVDVTGLLRRGDNKLRILVGNLAVNHMAGRRPPDYRLLNLRYGVRFEPQDMDKVTPVPAGLLGPVRLTAAAR
jgi:hypothetical protein